MMNEASVLSPRTPRMEVLAALLMKLSHCLRPESRSTKRPLARLRLVSNFLASLYQAYIQAFNFRSLRGLRQTTVKSNKQTVPCVRWSWPQPRVTWTGTCTSTWRCAAWRGAWTCRWRRAVAWSRAAGALPLSAPWPAATQGTRMRSTRMRPRMRCQRRTPKQKSPSADAASRLLAEIAGSHACRDARPFGPVWTAEVPTVADPEWCFYCGGPLFWECERLSCPPRCGLAGSSSRTSRIPGDAINALSNALILVSRFWVEILEILLFSSKRIATQRRLSSSTHISFDLILRCLGRLMLHMKHLRLNMFLHGQEWRRRRVRGTKTCQSRQRKSPWMHLDTTEVLCNLASLIFGLAFCPLLFVLKNILLAFKQSRCFIYLICILDDCLSVIIYQYNYFFSSKNCNSVVWNWIWCKYLLDALGHRPDPYASGTAPSFVVQSVDV